MIQNLLPRRSFILAAALTLVMLPTSHALDEAITIDVAKTRGCGCCILWIKHLEQKGFATTSQDMLPGMLIRHKLDSGVPQEMISCHTGMVAGYVIEGHVPAADIRQLLSERPDAIGLAVPGMPYGSPGMGPEDEREAYDVFLILKDGNTEIYSSYSGT